MASNRTKISILILLVNFIIEINCEKQVVYAAEDEKAEEGSPDVIDDVTLQESNIAQAPNTREPEADYDAKEEGTTELSTTAVPEALGFRHEEKQAAEESSNADGGENEDPTLEPVGVDYTLSSVDNNNVYKHIYDNNGTSRSAERNDVTTQVTPKSTEDQNSSAPEPDEESPSQRNPKTDNSESKPLPDKRAFEPKEPKQHLPAVSKTTLLRGWLEDSWLRPPAGILVPLRPQALNRALAVWAELAAAGLNVADVIVVGYDANGVNWRSRHNLQHNNGIPRDRDVPEALTKLLLKYQGVNADSTSDGTMRALATAAKLVPYDSALFVVTDKGPGDPQKLPLALRALVEKRLKVYTIWTDPEHPSPESEAALEELRNISKHTEGEVLPYALQAVSVESPNIAGDTILPNWEPSDVMHPPPPLLRRGKVHAALEYDKFDTLLIKRGDEDTKILGIPIETGVSALKISIEGDVERAVLYPPNDAPQIDLLNQTSVVAFSPVSRVQSLSPLEVFLVFPGATFNVDMLSVSPGSAQIPKDQKTMVGTWHISLRCDNCDYRLRVAARSLIHLDTESTGAGTLRVRVLGPVASVRESSLVDEYGAELAKLNFSCQPMISEDQDPKDYVTELVTDIALPAVKASRVYVKIVGRDYQDESFVRLSGPLSQPEVRISRSASLSFPDAIDDLERAEEENLWRGLSRMLYNDTNVLPFGRAVSQVVNQNGALLTSVQIGLSTRLYGAPGDNIQMHFEVTNYREQGIRFSFRAVGELRFLTGINPNTEVIPSGQTVNVIVTATISTTAQPGARDFVTFTATGVDEVSISTYIYVLNTGVSTADVWAPEMRHSFQGTCIGRLGSDCAQHTWFTSIVARDSLGGLLRITSSPVGVVYDSNFISGTREEVVATYRSTCCSPRLSVTAVDVYGNVNSYVIDISSYISEAGIAAIVLGVLLGILLICLLGYLIYWCVKRRKESRELPYSTSSRNIS